jgi:hypothetical protein
VVSIEYKCPHLDACECGCTRGGNYGSTNVAPSQKDKPLPFSSKKKPNFKTHTWSWNENLIIGPDGARNQELCWRGPAEIEGFFASISSIMFNDCYSISRLTILWKFTLLLFHPIDGEVHMYARTTRRHIPLPPL